LLIFNCSSKAVDRFEIKLLMESPILIIQLYNIWYLSVYLIQGDHLSGKPGNVREFDREKLPKTYCKLHICIHTGI